MRGVIAWARAHKVAAAVIVVALLALIGSAGRTDQTGTTSLATASPPWTPGAPATPSPTTFETAAPPPTVVLSPGRTVVGTVSVNDKTGDLVDDDGNPVRTPKYVDVVSFKAERDGTDLLIRLVLAKAPPASRSSEVEQLNYLFAVDTTGDTKWEYWINLQNRPDGTYVGSLDDWVVTYHYEGFEFRGSVVLVEDLLLVTVPLESRGSPGTIGLCALTQAAEPVYGTVAAEDNAPKGDCISGGPLARLAP